MITYFNDFDLEITDRIYNKTPFCLGYHMKKSTFTSCFVVKLRPCPYSKIFKWLFQTHRISVNEFIIESRLRNIYSRYFFDGLSNFKYLVFPVCFGKHFTLIIVEDFAKALAILQKTLSYLKVDQENGFRNNETLEG